MLAAFACLLIFIQANCLPYPSQHEKSTQFWRGETKKQLDKILKVRPISSRAKNAIIFIGDGMGTSVVTAARMYRGQKEGFAYEHSPLAFEQFPFAAIARTHSLDFTTTDSGAAATAMFAGVKVNIGTLGVGPEVKFGDCAAALSNPVRSIAEHAVKEGKWVGLVTTTRITDATPAAFYVHTPSRIWENDAQMTEQDLKLGCKDTARQLVEDGPGNKFKVILGGGSANFLPTDLSNGRRRDGRNLVAEWVNSGRQFVSTKSQLLDVDLAKVTQLLGLFSHSHLPFSYEQLVMSLSDIPTIEQMTEAALEILEQAPKGYLLLVEGARIDHALHGVMAKLALEDVLAFERAVKLAQSVTENSDTLIVVTADHGHTMTIGAGYPQRTVPVLGKFKHDNPFFVTSDNLPRTVLLFADGESAITFRNNGASQRRNLTLVDTEDAMFKFPAFIPQHIESHTAEDVNIYATGPYAHLFTGTCDNTFVYQALSFAMCVGPEKGPC